MRDDGAILMSKQGQVTHRIVGESLAGKLYRKEAAELWEMTERPVSRIARRIEEKGLWELCMEIEGRRYGKIQLLTTDFRL